MYEGLLSGVVLSPKWHNVPGQRDAHAQHKVFSKQDYEVLGLHKVDHHKILGPYKHKVLDLHGDQYHIVLG